MTESCERGGASPDYDTFPVIIPCPEPALWKMSACPSCGVERHWCHAHAMHTIERVGRKKSWGRCADCGTRPRTFSLTPLIPDE